MRVLSKKSGFSLIEVVLALGVIAFALVGIMGLFPVAMKSAQESQRETRATLIARQIFSDLRVATGTNRFVISGTNNATIISGTNNATNGLSLNSGTPLFIAYNTNGAPLNDIPGATFSNSYSAPAAAFLASVTVDTNTGIPNLSRVQTTVEAPAVAPTANRTKYTFVTLMNY